MEITVRIRSDTVIFETIPSDRRKGEIKEYENTAEGLKRFKFELDQAIANECKKVHVFHSEVVLQKN